MTFDRNMDGTATAEIQGIGTPTITDSKQGAAHRGGPPLSARLRTGTAPLHRRVESVLGLPDSIRTADAYRLWLGRFLGLYDPLERALLRFQHWDAMDLAPPGGHTASLMRDLASLGDDPAAIARAPAAVLPALPTFAHALGALYVLEGATLGGKLIGRDLTHRLGGPVVGAMHFFAGRGEATGPMWQRFRAGLDRFGADYPQDADDVLAGADRAFQALLHWFIPFRAGSARRT